MSGVETGEGEDGFFKIKSTKRSNPEGRTTLDVMHQQQVKKITEEHNDVDYIKEDINVLKKQIDNTNDDLMRGQLENQLNKLETELSLKEKDDRLYNYLLDTGDLLFEY